MQDWTPVVLNGGNGNKRIQDNTRRTEAIRAVSLKPEHVAKNEKLDNATQPASITKIPREIVKQLISGRLAKGLTQKDLATKLNITNKTLQDVETYKHAYDKKLVNKIARELGCVINK